MNRVGVLQMVDTLVAAGMERVAVNLANLLPADCYRSHLCTTRAEGPLADQVLPHVARLQLRRRGRFDPQAAWRLVSYLREQQIGLIHAHGSAIFLAAAAARFAPRARLIWHVHFGRYATENRPSGLYRLAVQRCDGVIAVNQPLADWARLQLRGPADRIWYIPNFVSPDPAPDRVVPLPGEAGTRIVCVANLRPEKDHATLLDAMRAVVRNVPSAHLLLLGHVVDPAYQGEVQRRISGNGLTARVTWLGSRPDVAAILRSCDVGVLSSVSEGLPLALLEYGRAGLATVATRTGQCAEVLDDGRAGLLVPPRSAPALADAILALLGSADRRTEMGGRFRQRVQEQYSVERGLCQICAAYGVVLGK